MISYQYPFPRKLIIVTVISDLITDYRVHKICQTLHNEGYRVLLIGSCHKQSIGLKERDYQTHRIRLVFRKSVLFYAEFNIRLFFWLLAHKADIYLGNDLDVMPGTQLSAFVWRKPLVYDSHEYFLGMAGMDQKPLRRHIWKAVEKILFHRVKYAYTVCDSVRNLYRRDYNKKLTVVRNLPFRDNNHLELTPEERDWIALTDKKIPVNKRIIILQGAGLNAHRGVEELIFSMLFLDGARFHLLIVGGGDIFPSLEKIVFQNNLQEKITLIPKVPFNVLDHFTRQAHLGLSIDKPSVINHRYSLPNKLFEYLHAGVPVLASRLVEQERIINHYNVGTYIEDHHPEHIAQKIREIFDNPGQWEQWKENTKLVREELNWENECKIIIDIFKQVERETVS
jgi:glycosyltransferase involved in cell wall biosynthesis